MQDIHEQVAIGTITDARTTSTKDFDRVITTCQDSIADNVSCAYEWYNMSDGEAEYGGDDSYYLFAQAADSLLHALERGESVIIHCHAGQSRSASVAISAIAVYEDMSFEETFNFVKEQRPIIQPNPQLRRYSRRFVEDYQ